MAVLNTTSPDAKPLAPIEKPRNTVPSANTSRADGATGTAAGPFGAGHAKRDRLAPLPLCVRHREYTLKFPGPSNSRHPGSVLASKAATLSQTMSKWPAVAPGQREEENRTGPNISEGKDDHRAHCDRSTALGRVSAAENIAPLQALGQGCPCHSPHLRHRGVRAVGQYQRQSARVLAHLARARQPGAPDPESRLPAAPTRAGSGAALGRLFLLDERARRDDLGADGDAPLPGAHPVS